MTKITIEQLTDVYQIEYGDYTAIIHGTDNLLKEIKSLTDNSKLSQKEQYTPKEPPGSYHKENKKPTIPTAKPGITKTKVHTLLDEGLTTAEIAVKLGLTTSAITYHEKSYIPKDIQPHYASWTKELEEDDVTPNKLPIKEPEEDIQISIPNPTLPKTIPEEIIEFQELKISLPKHMLTKIYGDRRNTDKHNLTYYSNEDGGLIIQYGTNKCYTTWNDLHNLPHPVPGEMLTKLDSQKKLGVKAFKNWMVRQTKEPKIEDPDPDADFKPLISKYQNTNTNYDGNKLDEVN